MFTAFLRALGQLTDPPILRVLGASVLLSLLCFVAAWSGVAWLLASLEVTHLAWLDTALAWLGGFATLVLTWFLFPLLASAFVGLFLDQVAVAVERRHYPHWGQAPGLGFGPALWCSVRFLGLAVLLNLLLLPLWLVPPAYPIGFYLVNGLLLGREYFDLVALRRIGPAATRTVRARHGLELLTMGAIGAFLMTIPLANFVAPVLLTAAMVHRFAAWHPQAGGG